VTDYYLAIDTEDSTGSPASLQVNVTASGFFDSSFLCFGNATGTAEQCDDSNLIVPIPYDQATQEEHVITLGQIRSIIDTSFGLQTNEFVLTSPTESLNIAGGSSPGACRAIRIDNDGSSTATNISIVIDNASNYQACTDGITSQCGTNLLANDFCNFGIQMLATQNAAVISSNIRVQSDTVNSNDIVASGSASGF
jgi:hypothetical protein